MTYRSCCAIWGFIEWRPICRLGSRHCMIYRSGSRYYASCRSRANLQIGRYSVEPQIVQRNLQIDSDCANSQITWNIKLFFFANGTHGLLDHKYRKKAYHSTKCILETKYLPRAVAKHLMNKSCFVIETSRFLAAQLFIISTAATESDHQNRK